MLSLANKRREPAKPLAYLEVIHHKIDPKQVTFKPAPEVYIVWVE
jgi:hypothetical protein